MIQYSVPAGAWLQYEATHAQANRLIIFVLLICRHEFVKIVNINQIKRVSTHRFSIYFCLVVSVV